MAICFFGAFDPFYPRTAIIRRGLLLQGQTFFNWRLPHRLKAWARYPLGLGQALINCPKLDKGTFFFVPAFGHKDVPLAFLIARIRSNPVIFDPLASRYETKILDWQRKSPDSASAKWNYILDLLSLKLADLILADTEAHRIYYCQTFGLNAKKVAVLPVGFDDSLWQLGNEVISKSNRTMTVVFFGSFLPLHGVDRMAQAALIVVKKEPYIRFLFIGTGQTFNKVKNILAKDTTRRIQLLGWMEEPKIVDLVKREADLCLGLFGETPKAQRVVPHKVFQAMALGKPVMTLDTPAIREFFTPGENIYLCFSSEPEVIAQSLIELYHNPERRQKIGSEGYRLVHEKFSPKVLGQSLLNILEEKLIGWKKAKLF